MTSTQLTFHQIKERLSERDILITDIAEALKVTSPHVTLVAKGTSSSFKVANAISLSLDLPINQVFGDKYDQPGKRGPKDRTKRKQQIFTALRKNKPVPICASIA